MLDADSRREAVVPASPRLANRPEAVRTVPAPLPAPVRPRDRCSAGGPFGAGGGGCEGSLIAYTAALASTRTSTA